MLFARLVAPPALFLQKFFFFGSQFTRLDLEGQFCKRASEPERHLVVFVVYRGATSVSFEPPANAFVAVFELFERHRPAGLVARICRSGSN